jgi:hypothetical protein
MYWVAVETGLWVRLVTLYSLIGMKGLKYLSLEFDKEDFNQTVGDMIRRVGNFQPFLY